MQEAVGGEAGMTKKKGKALSGILGGTGFKGNVKAKAKGTEVKRRIRIETQRSGEGWGALLHQRGV